MDILVLLLLYIHFIAHWNLLGLIWKCTSTKQNLALTFLGATNLAQFRGPLAESLWVGTVVVAVHLGVSRVVLASRSGLSWGAARGDKFWDTWSSVHFWSGRVRFSGWPLDVGKDESLAMVEWKQWLLTSATEYNRECMDQCRQPV